MTIGYITHADCLLHDMGDAHPECPARLRAISDRLIACGLDAALVHHDAPRVTREQLLRVHERAYLDTLSEQSPQSGTVWLDGDTAMNPHSLLAAERAAGAAALGVDLVMTGKHRRVFCAVRPPGHHAERDRAMGFCLYNNVAVAAYEALEQHGLSRVAIVDFDVHHGNGTEHIVAADSRILFCSTFQHPFYPHSGSESYADNVINVPLRAGAGGAAFARAVDEHWLPALRDFSPELVLISAGFDAHQADDMSGLAFVDSDYAWVTGELCAIANSSAQGRIVSSLEGGYELHALARSVEAHLNALIGGR
ncbi:MAG: histone deacetylase family protein [Chromatocurvus sp.]